MKGQFPWIGRSCGSAGGMTTSKINDKNVMRAKAFEVTNPNTPAQKTQRDFFKEVQKLSAQFSQEELRWLFPQKPKSMSRRNALSKQLAEAYTKDNTGKYFSISRLKKIGDAKPISINNFQVTEEDDTLTISWVSGLQSDRSFLYNNVAALTYNSVTKQMKIIFKNSKFVTDAIDIFEEGEWNPDNEYYIYLIVSDSTGNFNNYEDFLTKSNILYISQIEQY